MWRLFVSLFLLISLVPVVLATTVTLNPIADAEIHQFTPDNNYGNFSTMVSGELGQRANFEIRRAMLRFDLSGQVPVGAIINSVTLQVTVTMIPATPINSDFGVHLLLADWDESQVTWNSRLDGMPWSNPGASSTADSVPAPSSTVFVTGPGNYAFVSTPGLMADVQAWANDPSSNFGWLLLSEEGGGYSARHFATREDIGGNAPVLTIDFSPPPPSIVTQPKSQTVVVGSTVSFSVVASGTPPLQYQWQSNSVAIPGATNDTLVLTNVQLSFSGAQYSVTISDVNGSTNSQPATLTVQPLQSGVPFVTITLPTNGSTFPFGADVPVSAQAFESNGTIAQVEFFLGTNSVGAVTNTPFSVVLSNLAAGSYTLLAIATDLNHSSATSAPVSFSVLSSNVLSVSIVSPTNGEVFPAHSNITLAAEPIETNGIIRQVEFFLGTNSIGVVTTNPFALVVSNLAAGNYSATAVATDAEGTTATSPPVRFSVLNPPSVTLKVTPPGTTNFLLGTTLTNTATVLSNAANVTNVEFFTNNILLGSDTTPPFTFAWTPTATGLISLTAVAFDFLGQAGTSAPIVIRIHPPDSIPPSLTITSAPPTGTVLTNMVVLAGTSSDNIGLDHVEYQVTSGPFLTPPGSIVVAQGTSNWLAKITLAPGGNIVRIRSVDFATNSRTATRFFKYLLTSGLVVGTKGTGAVVPNLNDKDLEVGKIYTLKARPGPGQIFSGWTIVPGTNNTGIPTNPAVLSFELTTNLQGLVANFMPNPFLDLAGSYVGLFSSTNDPVLQNSGSIKLGLSKAGSFTAKITMLGATYSFSGQFDPVFRKADVPVLRHAQTPLALGLRLDPAGATNALGGFVTNLVGTNVLVAQILALPTPVGSQTKASAQLGPRAFVFQQTTEEGGVVVAANVAAFNSAAALTLYGQLTDGPKYFLRSVLGAQAQDELVIPLYLSFSAGRELIMGWIMFTGATDVTGQLYWFQPGADRPSILNVVPSQ